MRKVRFVFVVVLGALLLFGLTSGKFLVLDRPQRADVIVVLAGEADTRPRRGIELLSKSYAPTMILDVPAEERVYNRTMLDIAHEYLQGLPQKSSISICPIVGLSTKAETKDVAKCLERSTAHSVLLVTSDYHTRRAFSIFHRELSQYQFSVAAASDSRQFGVRWWQRRQWAKLNVSEWLRLVWWEAMDRWR